MYLYISRVYVWVLKYIKFIVVHYWFMTWCFAYTYNKKCIQVVSLRRWVFFFSFISKKSTNAFIFLTYFLLPVFVAAIFQKIKSMSVKMYEMKNVNFDKFYSALIVDTRPKKLATKVTNFINSRACASAVRIFQIFYLVV